MSTNIQVQRICQYCGKEFTARTTETRYCSHRCNGMAYKAIKRSEKVEASNRATFRMKTRPIEELKAKDFLTVREVATLLNCSVRSVYLNIQRGNIKAVNLGQRITRVKRSDLDKLFEEVRTKTTRDENSPEPPQFAVSDCYNLTEIQSKYGISDAALRAIIKRQRIPQIRAGRYAYVPKQIIDKVLG